MRKNILTILTMTVFFSLFAAFTSAQEKVKVGLLSFTGETSKINQNPIRGAMAEHLNSKGFLAAVSSGDERERAKNKYFIGVEIKKTVKSEITVIVTLYGKDKSVIRQVTKSRGGQNDDSLRTAGGGSDDSIRPMVLKGLDELASGIR
jgi:hypothetical protein